jgi:hypothetical protein
LSRNAATNADGCKQFILTCSTSEVLDIVDMSFRQIDERVRGLDMFDCHLANITQGCDDAIKELNHRFREHGLGYHYTDGRLDRIDSQFAHAEIVKPALSLLNASGFDGPADEFIRAFDHYRHGRNKEAIAEALKAFESTMKAICTARQWTHPANATAAGLLLHGLGSTKPHTGFFSDNTSVREYLQQGRMESKRDRVIRYRGVFRTHPSPR